VLLDASDVIHAQCTGRPADAYWHFRDEELEPVRVLLIEDEPEMAAALTSAFGRFDMLIDHAPTLAQAEAALASGVHDAILLDRQMPDGDGLDLIPKLRARGIGVPIIVLTALGEMADRVAGLDTGADDYVAKPFAVEELLARLRAVLRRPGQLTTDTLRVGRLSFDCTHRTASVAGTLLDLPRRELLVLESLIQRMGRTVLRASLEESVYGFDDEIQSNALDTHVSRLRRKLTDADAGVEIHAIRGIGYLLKRAPQ
jgi:DNA-binding response OmpR family regulator